MEETIGKRIMTLRKSRGLTQEQLAEKLGVTAQAVSKWENDISCPDITLLPKLAEVFQVSTDSLLGMPEQAEIVDKPPRRKTEPQPEEKDEPGFTFHWDLSRTSLPWFATAVLLFAVSMLLNRTLLKFYGEASAWELIWPSAVLAWGLCSLWSRFGLWGIGLTACGSYWLLSNLRILQVSWDLPWSIVLLVLLILWALSMLIQHFRGGKRWKSGHHHSKAKSTVVQTGDIRHDTSFGSDRIHVSEACFHGGRTEVSFGDQVLDLRSCSIVAADCVLEIDVSFGSMTVLLPENWRVSAQPDRSFGSVSTHGTPSPDADQLLQITGSVSFGNLDIRWDR